jgi:hypothetical protein
MKHQMENIRKIQWKERHFTETAESGMEILAIDELAKITEKLFLVR